MKLANRKSRLSDAAGYAVSIPCGSVSLAGDLEVPENPGGVVLFAHGSGSSRHSPRNRFVAQTLRDEGFATLLMDLLTAEEEQVDIRTAQLRFDIGLLTERLIGGAQWLREYPFIQSLRIGYFGASTGAAAALVAAAERPELAAAIVSRGGRPDLAGSALEQVLAPTLLIVGGKDEAVIEMNRTARTHLRCNTKLEIVPGATHLFEEPGTLEKVADAAANWFDSYLRPAA